MSEHAGVREARINGDTEALRAFGRAGARRTNEIKAAKRAARTALETEDALFDQVRKEQQQHELVRKAQEAGETILPLHTYE